MANPPFGSPEWRAKYAKKGTPFVWRTNAKGRGVLVNRKNGRLIVRESEE